MCTDPGTADPSLPLSPNRREPGEYISVACRQSRESVSDNRCGHCSQGGPRENEPSCGKRDQPKIIFRQPAPLAPPTLSWPNSCLCALRSPGPDHPFDVIGQHRPAAHNNIALCPPAPPFHCSDKTTFASVKGPRDPHVPVPLVKLADDPAAHIEPGGIDRHQVERRVEAYRGDHRPEHPPPGHHGVPPPAPPPYPPPYWLTPPMPGPPAFPPYERTNSPPRAYPYPQQYPAYAPYQPPLHISAVPPAPPYYPIPPYPIPPSHEHPTMQPPNMPPYTRPQMPPLPQGPIPGAPMSRPPVPPYQGLPPPPPFQAILPPPPLNYDPPPTRAFTLPPGADTQAGFKITVRQQPIRARMCGFGEKDRRPIDPPPIVELHELNGPLSTRERELLVLQCTLWNEEGTQERGTIREVIGGTAGLGTAEELPIQVEQKHAKNMMGENFANVGQYEDEHGNQALFFIFPDLSIRAEGRYRLKMDLLQLEIPGDGVPQRPGRIVAECLSHIFTVFQAKRFPGMMHSTELTRALAKQGVKVKTRNEPRRQRDPQNQPTRRERRPATESSDEEEGGESPDSPGSRRGRGRGR